MQKEFIDSYSRHNLIGEKIEIVKEEGVFIWREIQLEYPNRIEKYLIKEDQTSDKNKYLQVTSTGYSNVTKKGSDDILSIEDAIKKIILESKK